MTDTATVLECRIYVVWVWDPWDDYQTKRCGYIGETLRSALDRLAEHAEQPWSDTVVSVEVLPGVWPDKESVWAEERRLVELMLPLYNDEYNRDNPYRIDRATQLQQRAERDRARAVDGPQRVTVRRPGRWTRRLRKLAPAWLLAVWARRWALLWLASAVVVERHATPTAGVVGGAMTGAIGATLILAAMQSTHSPELRKGND